MRQINQKILIKKSCQLAAIFLVIGGFFVGLIYLYSFPVYAQNDAAINDDFGLDPIESSGLSNDDPRMIAARIIRVALGFLGLVAVLIVLYAGYMWMTAGGEQERVNTAKKTLKNGLIGLVIILMAFSIVSFVISRLSSATGEVCQDCFSNRWRGGGGGFPYDVLEDVYPRPDQKDVPRNTGIFVSFYEAMDVSTLVDKGQDQTDIEDDRINSQNIQIVRVNDNSAVAARAAMSDDHRYLAMQPIDYLGSPDENVEYKVILGTGILTANGDSAFGDFGQGYSWIFETGTRVDLDPPYVVRVIPASDPEGVNPYPRNVVVQVHYNEAMNPVSVVGSTLNGFDNQTVKDTNGNLVDGRYIAGSGYKTIEFITNNKCGTNSCGEDIYCLPGEKDLISHIRAATLEQEDQPAASFPFDGVVDAAGNSLDGNTDSVSQGNPDDDFEWYFSTTNEIDLTPPVINEITPSRDESGVYLNAVVYALFSKPLLYSTINPLNALLKVHIPDGSSIEKVNNYYLTSEPVGNQTKVYIHHKSFEKDTAYDVEMTSGIKDIFQNCFNPSDGPPFEE